MKEGGNAYWRFKWSHESVLHRLSARIYNQLLKPAPFSFKYGLGQRLRANSMPYSLIEKDWTVVQIGGPQDTLHAGRSRGMHFALLTRAGGKVIVVEPDVNSAQEFSATARRQGLNHVSVCQTAVWSEQKKIKLYIDPNHPATSFSEGTKAYDAERMKSYRLVELAATTIDILLAEQGIEKVDLVSITTNGAERPILQGMTQIIAAGMPYISLARTGDSYSALMETYGYRFLDHDDRGYTFVHERRL